MFTQCVTLPFSLRSKRQSKAQREAEGATLGEPSLYRTQAHAMGGSARHRTLVQHGALRGKAVWNTAVLTPAHAGLHVVNAG